MPASVELSVETVTLRRVYRVGACPVLEVTVTYPRLIAETSPAVARFNETYRAMAEAFLAWTDSRPREEAEGDFAAMGAAAPYRFDRRSLSFSASAAPPSAEGAPARLTVTRILRYGSRRGEVAERSATASDRWRVPEWTVETRPRDRRGER